MAAERILYINGGILDRGGITSYMMNYYRHFDRDVLQVDFVAHGGEGDMDREIAELGGRVWHVPVKRESPVGNFRALDHIFSSGGYRLVHAHMDAMNALVLWMAKRRGVPVRISHSHNTDHLTRNPLKRAAHDATKAQIRRFATHLWACSGAAGRWLYGEGVEFTVIPNAIDAGSYAYRPEVRESLRRDLGWEGRFVIGMVGRLEERKNPAFLIRLMPRLLEKVPETLLALAGDGSQRQEYETLAAGLGLNGSISFLGERGDLPDLFNAFDLMVMPSLFEGLPMSLVEAQANGLHCLVSEMVPTDADLSGEMEFLPFREEVWRERILSLRSRSRASDAIGRLEAAGYEVGSAAKALQNKYLNMLDCPDSAS